MAGRFRPLYEALKSHGDVHERPRDVNFAAFFSTSATRDAWVETITPRGYRVTDMTGERDPRGRFIVVMTMKTPIDPPSMAPLIAEVRESCVAHGGIFDGWACPVETG